MGTRASALALAQSKAFAAELERTHRRLGLRVEVVPITTSGDKDRRSPLKSFGGTGVFVKELERALTEKRIDFAVHSLKDLPLRQPKGLMLAAISKREDVRDVLVMRAGARLAAGSVVGTGSLRRRAQLVLMHAELMFIEMRGNVETRMRKVADGVCDATLLAHAGLKRLGWCVPAKGLTLRLKGAASALRLQLLSTTQMLPAPGQGALGIECRVADRVARRLLGALNDPCTAASTDAERACLAGVGGGCDLPLGAYAKPNHARHRLELQALLALPDGRGKAFAALNGPPSNAVGLGRRAGKLLCSSPVGKSIQKGSLK
jgi:hydroxymethylbilane synthase